LPMKMPRTLPHEDATGLSREEATGLSHEDVTGLPRGTSRSLLTPDQTQRADATGSSRGVLTFEAT
jgi:hypothetical protein